MKICILGFGYTGQRLAQELLKQGHSVVGSNRSGHPVAGLNVPISKFFYESHAICDPRIWTQSFDGVTHIISTIAPTPNGQDPGWELLQLHQAPQQLKWVGYLSTTGVYGDTGGTWVDELSPVQPGNSRSQSRVTIEQQWLNSDLPTHIFRLPGIYGPGRSIFEKIKSGTVQQIYKPGHVFCRVHVDDIVQTLIHSMHTPSPGEIYNIVDDEPSEPRELVLLASQLLKISPPDPIPFEQAQLSSMGRSFWDECRRVSNQKIKEKLNVHLLYPTYREGLQAIFSEL